MEVLKNEKIIRYYDMEIFRRKDKLRMEFLAPATEKGRRMLSDDDNLWMYLPRTSKVMKLPFKQSFMGSDASNRDLMRMAYRKDYIIVKTTEKSKNILELELKAKDASVSYNKMIVTMDMTTLSPLKQEMFSLSDKLIKTMLFENPAKVDGIYIPSTFIIINELQKNTITRMYYSNMQRTHNKPEEFFTLASIKK
jgi:outer membrane lipoprotein-sorting protein